MNCPIHHRHLYLLYLHPPLHLMHLRHRHQSRQFLPFHLY
jgi:hypothetical protein